MGNRIRWATKQILPLSYVSEYGVEGERRLSIWRMWMGRCFNVREYTLKG